LQAGVKRSSNQDSPEAAGQPQQPTTAHQAPPKTHSRRTKQLKQDPLPPEPTSTQKKETKEEREYIWGYGSGVAAATNPVYGDVVLAEYTLPSMKPTSPLFVPGCVVPCWRPASTPRIWLPMPPLIAGTSIRVVLPLAWLPCPYARSPRPKLTPDGVPLCAHGLRMHPTYQFQHTNGYRAQRYRCPYLFPERTGDTCGHAQFVKEKGCVKDINIELGGLRRVLLDRTSPQYHAVYNQRTACERINSTSLALGIERPKVCNLRSVRNLNTLIYLVINGRALERAKSINRGLLQIK